MKNLFLILLFVTIVFGWTDTVFKQCDSAWGGQRLGTCTGTTICDAGCAICSVAMFEIFFLV
jgi:hypothetical protein